MFVLEHFEKAKPGEIKTSFHLVAGAYTLGRAVGLQISFTDEIVCSRKHAVIRVEPGTSQKIFIKDLGSKFGLTVNNADVGQTEVELHDGDVFSLGKSNTRAIRVRQQSVVLCTSRLSKQDKVDLKELAPQLGATLVTGNWSPECTHLITGEQPQFTVKVVCALARAAMVVNIQWLKAVVKSARETPSSALPSAAEYAPKLPTLGDVNFAPDPRRADALKSYVIILCTENKDTTMLVEYANGTVLQLSGGYPEEDLEKRPWETQAPGKTPLVMVDQKMAGESVSPAQMLQDKLRAMGVQPTFMKKLIQAVALLESPESNWDHPTDHPNETQYGQSLASQQHGTAPTQGGGYRQSSASRTPKAPPVQQTQPVVSEQKPPGGSVNLRGAAMPPPPAPTSTSKMDMVPPAPVPLPAKVLEVPEVPVVDNMAVDVDVEEGLPTQLPPSQTPKKREREPAAVQEESDSKRQATGKGSEAPSSQGRRRFWEESSSAPPVPLGQDEAEEPTHTRTNNRAETHTDRQDQERGHESEDDTYRAQGGESSRKRGLPEGSSTPPAPKRAREPQPVQGKERVLEDVGGWMQSGRPRTQLTGATQNTAQSQYSRADDAENESVAPDVDDAPAPRAKTIHVADLLLTEEEIARRSRARRAPAFRRDDDGLPNYKRFKCKGRSRTKPVILLSQLVDMTSTTTDLEKEMAEMAKQMAEERELDEKMWEDMNTQTQKGRKGSQSTRRR